MKKKDLTVLIEGLRKLSADITEIADLLSGTETPKETQEKPADPVKEEVTPAAEEVPEKVYSKEEVRAILADKSRSGFRAEVKALLTAHGVKQLSDVKEPDKFAAIVAEAEVIGNG
jgi:hypothetical protein